MNTLLRIVLTLVFAGLCITFIIVTREVLGTTGMDWDLRVEAAVVFGGSACLCGFAAATIAQSR